MAPELMKLKKTVDLLHSKDKRVQKWTFWKDLMTLAQQPHVQPQHVEQNVESQQTHAAWPQPSNTEPPETSVRRRWGGGGRVRGTGEPRGDDSSENTQGGFFPVHKPDKREHFGSMQFQPAKFIYI